MCALVRILIEINVCDLKKEKKNKLIIIRSRKKLKKAAVKRWKQGTTYIRCKIKQVFVAVRLTKRVSFMIILMMFWRAQAGFNLRQMH